jgi:hypothetical protein
MDILRNIEKKILNIANNNTNSASEINNLKKDIKLYLDIFDKREELNKKKKDIYDELYENKRKAQRISYENYLSDKNDLMKGIIKDKTKGAIRKYLECKYEAEDIPDIYTYENISLDNSDNVEAPIVLKPTPPKERKVIKAPKRPTVPKKLPKHPIEPVVPVAPVAPVAPVVPAVNVVEPMVPKPPTKPKKLPKPVAVPAENVIEPMVPKPPAKPKKLPKLLNEPKMPPGAPDALGANEGNEVSIVPPKPPNKLPKLNKDAKECPEGEEISPKTGKCVKKCKEGEVRNVITGRCNKIKESKAAPKAAPKV